MIIVKAQGGLGNQMFQYALYKMLKEAGKNVKFDISAYKSYSLHNGFEIDKIFNLDIDYANYINVCESLISKANYIAENINMVFIPELCKINDGYLSGYWQNENYFKNIKEKILQDFKFKINDKQNNEILKVIQNTNSVSIHFRRGDYINNLDARRLYGNITTVDYYRNAINIIKNKVINPKFIIFSDDTEWVKDNFKIEDALIVDINKYKDSYKDMFLMSQCKHNIIANSSFSWWGAWLNQNKDKIVICPDKWLNGINTPEICCNQWIKCSSVLGANTMTNHELDLASVAHKIVDCSYEADKFQAIKNIFEDKNYSVIEKYDKECRKELAYLQYREALERQDEGEILRSYHNFISNIEYNYCSFDNNLYVSSIYHLACYFYNKNDFVEAKKLFLQIDMLTKGKHKKAKEYLNSCNISF